MKRIRYSILWLLLLVNTMAGSAQSNTGLKIKIYCTNWGMTDSWDVFCAKVKDAGFDGVETWLPGTDSERSDMLEALKRYELSLGLLCGGGGRSFQEYHDSFVKNIETAIRVKSDYINCHTGKDYYTFQQNSTLIDAASKLSKLNNLPIYHETHRGRFSFAAHVTKRFLEELPALSLALDISHWCSVHESLLGDQKETVELALQRTGHIHARVGHPQGPQVNDFTAPEWKSTLEQHLAWWDRIVQLHKENGRRTLTITTEFGPAGYLPTLPFTQQPVSSQWQQNVSMLKLLRARYQ